MFFVSQVTGPQVLKLQGSPACVGNSSTPPSRLHRQLRWRPLSSPSPAPASFLGKLGSPREQVCPWGKPLAPAPGCSAEGQRGVRRPHRTHRPACTRASPGRWARCRRSPHRGAEARQDLGPGCRAAPRRSCTSSRFVAGALALPAEPPPPPPGDPGPRPRRGAAAGRCVLPGSLLPRSSRRRRLFRGKAGAQGLSTAPGTDPGHGGGPRPGSAPRARVPVRSRFGPGAEDGPGPRGLRSRQLGASAPRPWTAPAASPEQSPGWARVPWGGGWASPGGSGPLALQPRGEPEGEGELVAIALWSAVRRGLAAQWRVPSSWESGRGGRRDRGRRS